MDTTVYSQILTITLSLILTGSSRSGVPVLSP